MGVEAISDLLLGVCTRVPDVWKLANLGPYTTCAPNVPLIEGFTVFIGIDKLLGVS